MLLETEVENTGVRVGLAVMVVITLRNQFGFGQVKYPSEEFQER